MKTITKILATTGILVVNACATTGFNDPKTAYVEYMSVPTGAMLQSKNGSQPFGYSPWVLAYPWDSQYVDSNGCLTIEVVKVEWISGATAYTDDPQRMCGGPGYYQVSINRPQVLLDKAQIDYDFAEQIEAIRAQQTAQRQQQNVDYLNALLFGFGSDSAKQTGNVGQRPADINRDIGNQFETSPNQIIQQYGTNEPSGSSHGIPVYTPDECTGPIVMGQCHSLIPPKGSHRTKCYGQILNGNCTGPMF